MKPRESQSTETLASSTALSSSPTLSHSSLRVGRGGGPAQLQSGPSIASLKCVSEPTTDSNTQIYEGQWEGDRREGHGILKIPGRYTYLGQWKNNCRTGYGVVLHECGRKEEGLWEEGKLVLPLKRKKLSIKHHQLETKVKAAHTAALQAADFARTKSILAESRSLGVTKRSNAALTSAAKAEADATKAREVSHSLSCSRGKKATGRLRSSFPSQTDFMLLNREVSAPAENLLSVPVLTPAPSFEDMQSLPDDDDDDIKESFSSTSSLESEKDVQFSANDGDTISVQSEPSPSVICIKVNEGDDGEDIIVPHVVNKKRASVPHKPDSVTSSRRAFYTKSKSMQKQSRLMIEEEEEEELTTERSIRRRSQVAASRIDQSTG